MNYSPTSHYVRPHKRIFRDSNRDWYQRLASTTFFQILQYLLVHFVPGFDVDSIEGLHQAPDAVPVVAVARLDLQVELKFVRHSPASLDVSYFLLLRLDESIALTNLSSLSKLKQSWFGFNQIKIYYVTYVEEQQDLGEFRPNLFV